MRWFTLRRLAALAIATGSAATLHAAPCAGFTDVEDSDAFCTSIAWMKNRAITLGCTATLYCPGDFVRRDQMAAFMYRLGFQNAFLQGGNAFGATAVAGTLDNHAVHVRVNGATAQRWLPAANAESGAVPNVVAGHEDNAAARNCALPILCVSTEPVVGAVIAGGGAVGAEGNRVSDSFGTVSGGRENLAGDDDAQGAGSDAGYATVGGGRWNAATAIFATVGGGGSNRAEGSTSTVGGGTLNVASGLRSTVGGGSSNVAEGSYATIPGGNANRADGDFSFAAGGGAHALHDGSFVFADASTFANFASTAAHSFRVRATGGVQFVTGVNGSGSPTWSCTTSAGSGWTCSSDRALKQDLVPLDGEAVLDRLAAMPVYAWHPKGANAHVRHFGPMAQDFHAAFGLGDDDTMIGMQDADGVALAAIQGLDRRLRAEVAALRERTHRLEDALAALLMEVRALRGNVAAR